MFPTKRKFLESLAWIRVLPAEYQRKAEPPRDRVMVRGIARFFVGPRELSLCCEDGCEIWVDGSRRELVASFGDVTCVVDHSGVSSVSARQDASVSPRPFAEFAFPHSVVLRIVPQQDFPPSFASDIEWARSVLAAADPQQSIPSAAIAPQSAPPSAAECYSKWIRFVRSVAVVTSPEFLAEATREVAAEQVSKVSALHAEVLRDSDLCSQQLHQGQSDSYELHLLKDVLLPHRGKAFH